MEIKGLGAQPCGEGRGQYFALLPASGSASAITSERDASTVWHAYSLGPPLIARLVAAGCSFGVANRGHSAWRQLAVGANGRCRSKVNSPKAA